MQRHSSLVLSNPTTAKLDLLAGFNVSFGQSTAGQRDLEALARSFYSGAFVGPHSSQGFESKRLVWHRTNQCGTPIALQSIGAISLSSRKSNSLNKALNEVFMYLPISLGGIVLVLVVLYLLGVI